jgi:hypothetical protein
MKEYGVLTRQRGVYTFAGLSFQQLGSCAFEFTKVGQSEAWWDEKWDAPDDFATFSEDLCEHDNATSLTQRQGPGFEQSTRHSDSQW